ncbi:MAG: nucleotide exchange factor GrpE [Acidobacteriota bacterium]
MTEEIRRQEGEADPESSPTGDETIEITSVEAVSVDAPPPAASPTGPEDRGAAADEADREVPAPAACPGPEEDLKARVEDVSEDLLRVRAEFENYRKRQARERTEFARRAASDLVVQILPVLDNFKRALNTDENPEDVPESYRQGIRMIYEQLMEILRKEGLADVEALGKPFDPTVHEAVAREETARVEPNTIIEELEPGYLLRDRLLKPARVRVAVRPDDS